MTTEEAFQVCDSLGRLGLKRITLSGGEPFTRPDWDQLVRRLNQNKISTNILSNGWLVDRDTIRKAKEAGITNLGMSMDGIEETHDYIRRKGSFAHIMNALQLGREEKLPTSIVTCVHKKNIGELPQIKEILIEKGVYNWQLQAASPMGNLLEHPDWLLEPEDIDTIIDFAYDVYKEGKIKVTLADVIGYFNLKEIELRRVSSGAENYSGIWRGCAAGKDVVGIRCNGDIIGCLSVRDDSLIEGNIRQMSLEDIWNRPGAFSWNREMTKNDLAGFCKICQYGSYCLGGCSKTKLLRYKTFSENKFCSYHSAISKEREKIHQINDYHLWVTKGREMIEKEEFQLAEIHISKALEVEPNNIELLNLLGFIHYSMDNFQECEEFNRKALQLDPGNAYSLKGLGICLTRRGRVEEGIDLLKQSIQRAEKSFMDPYNDLAVILWENKRNKEALEILETGRSMSEEFCRKTDAFYNRLKSLNNVH